jgi:hydroxymethylpyrimidine/phosphomethylpyrimidine kinase
MAAVLVIAGTDSSGGAGLTRDLRTLSDFGVEGIAVVTAVTAQTSKRVHSVELISPALIRDQIETAFASTGAAAGTAIKAIKIGMLGTREIVEAVAECLPSRDDVPIVLDPVLAATSGRVLLDEAGRRALLEHLIPQVTVLTPNLPEAAVLLGEGGVMATIRGAIPDRVATARRLMALGPSAVLLKGGHSADDGASDDDKNATDVLVSAGGEVKTFTSPRQPGTLRGTGCMLASAIAANLARGAPLADACQSAKAYLSSRWAEVSRA